MDEVIIVEYDLRWQTLFAAEAARIKAALDKDLIVAIEHIGSTAVLGLAAKPIIDLMIGVRSLVDAQSAISPLEALGYLYWRENPDPTRIFFVKGMPPSGTQRTHHVHIVEVNGEFWQRLLFRDYLRIHEDEAQRYEALKRELAARFPNDRQRYTDGKSEYIQAVMQLARTELSR